MFPSQSPRGSMNTEKHMESSTLTCLLKFWWFKKCQDSHSTTAKTDPFKLLNASFVPRSHWYNVQHKHVYISRSITVTKHWSTPTAIQSDTEYWKTKLFKWWHEIEIWDPEMDSSESRAPSQFQKAHRAAQRKEDNTGSNLPLGEQYILEPKAQDYLPTRRSLSL